MEPWKLQPARDLGLPVGERLKSVRRESGLVEAMTQHVWWFCVRILLRLFHRLTVSGRERLPTRGPFIVVANHNSHLDALVLASVLPPRLRENAFPVAAGDTFFKTRAMSAFAAATLNALPIWRKAAGHHALDQLRERLNDEASILLLFPEGTRSRDGTMGSFKAGVGMLLAQSEVPVVPCRIFGTFEALPATKRFPKPAKIGLQIGSPVSFTAETNDRPGWQRIAERLESLVRELSDPTQGSGNESSRQV